MRFKKGEMVSENAIGLILAIAVTLVLVLLMISLFSPTFNKGKEGAESYFDSLLDAVGEVDESGKSSFFMLDLDDEELEFSLVYFGEALLFVEDEEEFVRSSRGGSLCICYKQREIVLCDDCIELDGMVVFEEGVPWIIREGEYVSINKKGDDYVFVRG